MSTPHRHDPKAQFLAERGALHPHPGQAQDALFRTGTFFDARDLIQVRYEMVRRYRVDAQPASRVARSFGVSRQSLYLLARAVRGHGLPGLFPRKRGPKAAHKWTDEVLAFARARRPESPQLPLDELLAGVREHLGIHLHRRTLERRLTVSRLARSRVQLPVRVRTGKEAGQVRRVPPTLSRVLHILKNPRYAGAYFYGRTRQKEGVPAGALPRDQWKVFIPGARPGYITRDGFEAHQKALERTACRHDPRRP
jgi:hypothetical protein